MWVTRAALGCAAVVGAFLIVIPLATGLPGKSSASGTMMSSFRPQMSDSALAQGRADQQTMGAMGAQLATSMMPALAAQMHMTPQQLTAYLGTNYPAVAKGMGEFSAIQTFFGDLQITMQAQQANFQQADAIPTSYLPPTAMTALFVVPGVGLLLFGGLGLLRPVYGRRLVAVTGAISLVMVAGLFSTAMYAKATAADQMTTAFKPIFAAQSVQQAGAYVNDVQAMSVEFTQKALPGLAAGLHLTSAQMSGMITQNFPAVAAGSSQLPAIVQRMQSATGLIAANVDNYNQSASIPWSPGSMAAMFWFMMIPALLVIGVSGGALALTTHSGTASRPLARLRGAMHH